MIFVLNVRYFFFQTFSTFFGDLVTNLNIMTRGSRRDYLACLLTAFPESCLSKLFVSAYFFNLIQLILYLN